MKTLCFALVVVLGGLSHAQGQDTTTMDQQQTPVILYDQERDRLNTRDLPDAVKRSLEEQEYRGWLINAAYKTTGMDFMYHDNSQTDTTDVAERRGTGRDVYVVELKNGAQTKTVRFSEEGERLDDGGR